MLQLLNNDEENRAFERFMHEIKQGASPFSLNIWFYLKNSIKTSFALQKIL